MDTKKILKNVLIFGGGAACVAVGVNTLVKGVAELRSNDEDEKIVLEDAE